MNYLAIILILGVLFSIGNTSDLNLQFHFDLKRSHPTVTQEYFRTDSLGYTFFFMDINFNHWISPDGTGKAGGVSDVYFEFMRYFRLYRWKTYDLNFTVQYDDGTAPVEQIWLAGLNLGNIQLGPLNLSSEILLKKDYKLGVNWQFTTVWYAAFFNEKLVFNGFFDYWANDVNNPHWPAFDPEFKASRFSFQAEPQIGWLLSPHWKIGSEVEIDRGFIGSVTGKMALEEKYRHNRWYFLPTLFVQYDF
ncbi:hypothetical protein B1H10_07325 [candidate division KSB1 bacterium 4484_188]|nr:MAG: hypothetical protein B1H10_07325 [candidate division KSB1 bacterium 4484_188]